MTGQQASLEAQLRALTDRQEIRDVIAHYFRGVDRGDWELVRSCYHDDALDHHGSLFEGPATEFIDWVSKWLAERFDCTHHVGGQSLIELDGDVADVETYAVALHRGTPPEIDGPIDVTVGARLLDRFERRAGTWRIAHRELVDDWARIDPVNTSFVFEPETLLVRRAKTASQVPGGDGENHG